MLPVSRMRSVSNVRKGQFLLGLKRTVTNQTFVFILIEKTKKSTIVVILTLRLLMSYIYIYIYIYIYGAPILDVSRSHTTTQHSR